MIFRICLTFWALLQLEVQAVAYSTVNVKSNSEVLPYYPPAPYSFPSPYARLTAPVAPVPSILPNKIQTSLQPCIAPCIPLSDYLAQVVPIAAPLNLNSFSKVVPVYGPPAETRTAKITDEAKTPLPKEDNSYQYSYLVYDEDTGDRKAQQESSDGSKVQGQYSLIQPDGYIREVQYTADDLTGFNAVVKNFLPDPPITSKPSASGVTNEAKAKLQNLKPPAAPKTSQNAELIETAEVTADVQKVEPLKKSSSEGDNKVKESKEDGPKKIILSYEDIIRCANLIYGANSKDSSKDGTALTDKPRSALTYIILPSFGFGKPC